jgi:tRNA nucleotidyltransferase (CCA-adding enzyme)
MRVGGRATVELRPPAELVRRVPRAVRRVVERLQRAGHSAHPVGGCVRDLLLGRRVGDWDLTTDARPEQVTPLFDKVIPTGVEHGTVTVLMGHRPIEVTTYRGESAYSDGRHPDRVVFLDSLEADLERRDFTINAMALELTEPRLIDPFGGRRDLQQGLIRAVGRPADRFAEDGLRPMRAVRFAAVLDFAIEPDTFSAIEPAAPVFRRVALERIRDELVKLLAGKRPAKGIELLRRGGLLDHVLPGLAAAYGHPQNRFHRHDVYHHSLRCLEKARGDPVLKLAVLLHDIGKPATAAGPPGEHTFYCHERESAAQADRLLARLRFSNRDRERVRILIANHMFHYEPQWTDGAVRRLIRRVGPERLDDLWEMRRADAWGRGPGLHRALANLRALQARVDKVLAEQDALTVKDLAIDGRDVMRVLGCAPGPRVGQVLDALLERVLDEPELNHRDRLLELVAELEHDPCTGGRSGSSHGCG